RGQQHDAPRALAQDAGGEPAELEAAARRRRRRVCLLAVLRASALIADDVAAVAVHCDRKHWIREPLSVEVEVEQSVGERVRDAVAVQRPVGVGHVDAGFEQAAREKAPGGRLTRPGERLVARLTPDVRTATETLERLERER